MPLDETNPLTSILINDSSNLCKHNQLVLITFHYSLKPCLHWDWTHWSCTNPLRGCNVTANVKGTPSSTPPLSTLLLTHWCQDNMAATLQTIVLNESFFNENMRILIEISLKFVPKGPINNIPTLVHWFCLFALSQQLNDRQTPKHFFINHEKSLRPWTPLTYHVCFSRQFHSDASLPTMMWLEANHS